MENNELKNIEKKIKGYGFDSLVFRYKLAREGQARGDYITDHKNGRKYELDHYMRMADRDIMRFIQILDEMIGEHD